MSVIVCREALTFLKHIFVTGLLCKLFDRSSLRCGFKRKREGTGPSGLQPRL